MKKSRSNSRFLRGIVVCLECGKRTRDTGRGESNLGLCSDCIEAQEWANGINDGSYTLEDVPEERRAKVASFL